MKLTSDAVEVVNRNALVTVALNQGYNAYLPVYDNGIDLILLNEATGDTKLVQLKGRWTIDKKYIGRNIWVAFPDRGVWYVAPPTRCCAWANATPGPTAGPRGPIARAR